MFELILKHFGINVLINRIIKIDWGINNLSLPTQQIPNPAAQVPVATPPLLEHSAEVKQVPLRPVDVVQALFGNRTIENSERTKKNCFYLRNALTFKMHTYILRTYFHLSSFYSLREFHQAACIAPRLQSQR